MFYVVKLTKLYPSLNLQPTSPPAKSLISKKPIAIPIDLRDRSTYL